MANRVVAVFGILAISILVFAGGGPAGSSIGRTLFATMFPSASAEPVPNVVASQIAGIRLGMEFKGAIEISQTLPRKCRENKHSSFEHDWVVVMCPDESRHGASIAFNTELVPIPDCEVRETVCRLGDVPNFTAARVAMVAESGPVPQPAASNFVGNAKSKFGGLRQISSLTCWKLHDTVFAVAKPYQASKGNCFERADKSLLFVDVDSGIYVIALFDREAQEKIHQAKETNRKRVQ